MRVRAVGALARFVRTDTRLTGVPHLLYLYIHLGMRILKGNLL